MANERKTKRKIYYSTSVLDKTGKAVEVKTQSAWKAGKSRNNYGK